MLKVLKNNYILIKVNKVTEIAIKICRALKIVWKSSPFICIFSLINTILNGVMVSVTTIISKYFLDSITIVLTNSNTYEAKKHAFFWLILEFTVVIFSYILNRLNSYFADIQSKSLNIYISDILMKKTNELDLSYFENSEFYNKIEKASAESISSILSVTNSLMQFIQSIATLIGTAAIVLTLNPLILILCVLTTIPMFFVNIKISQMKYDVYNKRIEEVRFAHHLKFIATNCNSIKELRLNRLEGYFRSIIISILRKHLNQDKDVGKKQFIRLAIVDILSTIISYCYKFYVVILTIAKGLTIGSMNMYIQSLTSVENSIRSTLDNMASLYSNNLYMDNFFDVVDLKAQIADTDNSIELDNKGFASIEFKNVSFKYPSSKTYILKNINLTIKNNQTCAIVGLNGSGKTTLTKLLTRLYDPTEGEIYINGIDIKKYTLDSLYKNISVIFQDFMKYPFSIKDNIGFGNLDKINDIDLIKKCATKSNSYEFIDKLENKFDTQLQKMWSNGIDLSLGQWQKLAISRAFMSDSSILILDEPTASLDAEAEYEIFNNFKELIGTSTSVLISHRFSTVKMADIIYVLENGQITESGTHPDLMLNNGLYSRLYKMQAEAFTDIDKAVT
ncbi:ABC transporter ATP-binding protein [Inconstantimicrobium mannanitabidum]|uniref:ABC transporter ATP-binding protein n=1 Tax=Inconstantimicrobium mannanitabidum TaxID=1604901 RepID=UPI0035E43A9F